MVGGTVRQLITALMQHDMDDRVMIFNGDRMVYDNEVVVRTAEVSKQNWVKVEWRDHDAMAVDCDTVVEGPMKIVGIY
ncbi:hypothetical protein SEA_LOZINAK_15 [Gordonia phage Lozinak]|uniref:Uncharacterized protein n=5 Tax=Smoothievirus TaxID=1982557 RepID=A0A2D1GFL3_9CAUD|nr:hypothetical protein BEN60_gp015 [Gordonia phage Smoothie]YP_009273058.1 hypothetical protein BH768_gp015 [Gordonia phage ClubL]YP_009276135.1 hypothetical protein BH772_gp016 [Gordonia phage Bachita]YP_009281176.1 hypothetical protein BIZ74_gp014 [Gordonia phage Cucurbita]ATN90648.1 hypothetical protein SEA_LOZINAK_15 [Gordonia phage Lozinak]AUE23583.1 hypothetical protein SEA_TONIANN_15 [Gordonia phage Toniann]QAU06887.1 hypothetical protein SEA_APHELION_15 [Gordonia phage Aphelion]QKY7